MGNNNKIRLLLADDSDIIRMMLREMIESSSEIELIGEAKDGEECVEITRSLHPDVILMDIRMPKVDGIEATRRIKQENESVVIIGLSVHQDDYIVEMMANAGATDLLLKDDPPEKIFEVIRERYLQHHSPSA